jgi:dolichol-phosphate mannosyltransferase
MHRFIPVYLGRLGARITELEVDHRPRRCGRSKYGLRRTFNVALDLVLVRFMSRYSTRPMQFFGQAALVFLALTALVAVLMVVFKLGWTSVLGLDYQADFVETPLPALAGALFVGSVLSLFSGILGELLIRVLYESQGSRPYSVVSVLEADGERG